MVGVGGMRRKPMVRTKLLHPLEEIDSSRDILSNVVGTIKTKRRSRNNDDRFDFHQGAPDSV